MNSNLKSLLSSVGFVFFYVFATIGIVKLLWPTEDEDKYEGRVKFLVLFQILFAFIYIIGIYWIVGVHNVDKWYIGFIIAQVVYSVLGLFSYIAIERE